MVRNTWAISMQLGQGKWRIQVQVLESNCWNAQGPFDELNGYLPCCERCCIRANLYASMLAAKNADTNANLWPPAIAYMLYTSRKWAAFWDHSLYISATTVDPMGKVKAHN